VNLTELVIRGVACLLQDYDAPGPCNADEDDSRGGCLSLLTCSARLALVMANAGYKVVCAVLYNPY
jgi:hypothetical protein